MCLTLGEKSTAAMAWKGRGTGASITKVNLTASRLFYFYLSFIIPTEGAECKLLILTWVHSLGLGFETCAKALV